MRQVEQYFPDDTKICLHMTLPLQKDDQPRRAGLRVMATSDLHMHLMAYNYYAARPERGLGLTRIATLIANARTEARAAGQAVLLLDNGDALQGTPMGETGLQMPGPHPLTRAFSCLGYDAVGLGNHDFNFGLEALRAAVASAPYPVICSNMHATDGTRLPFVGQALLDRSVEVCGETTRLRIGLLSVLPPQTVQWDGHLLDGRVAVDAIVPAARRAAESLRAAGADLVIALAHTGLDEADGYPSQENAAIPLAGIDGIDALITGHSHLLLPGAAYSEHPQTDHLAGTIHGKPAIMPGSAGSHLGLMDLELEQGANGQWAITGHIAQLRAVSCNTVEDPDLLAVLQPAHAATLARLEQQVGHSTRPLHSYFSFFAPDAGLALVAQAQADAVRAQLPPHVDVKLLSAVAPGKYGARSGPSHYTDVPAGPVLQRHVADLHIFPNELRAVYLTGAQVLDWLEVSASLFHQIEPGGQGQPLVNPDMPGHDFDVLHGLTYEIDLGQPARYGPGGRVVGRGARRISRAAFDGNAVQPDQSFLVALNNYRASGGGHIAGLVDAPTLPLPPMTVQEVVRRHLARVPRATKPEGETWRFAPMPGTTVTCLTGPGALARMDDLEGRGVSTDGVDDDGFLRIVLPL
jgi:2',3'-cyclic-nucleotide 2'-phosphodiesterase/3'-nucleotidase